MVRKERNDLPISLFGRKESRVDIKAARARLVLVILLLTAFSLGVGSLASGPSSVSADLQRASATEGISEQAALQISALIQEKLSRTPAQSKLNSHLHFAAKLNRGEPIASGVSSLDSVTARIKLDDQQLILVDIKASVTPVVLDRITELRGEVISSFPDYNAIRARMPLAALENLAELPDVRYIGPEEEYLTNGASLAAALPGRAARAAEVRRRLVDALPKLTRATTPTAGARALRGRNVSMPFIGSATSQGDHAHQADLARTAFGINGSGVKIGVLSDGVNSRAARIASGDLPAGLTVLAAGAGDEGTAMLEIVYDLAPGAQLFFATASGGSAVFASNIIALRTAGCDIIVDDFTYFAEGVYQDGIIAQAVNTVTAGGALYFSSAGNSGNKNDSQSGTWEGDFVNSGMSIPALPAGAGLVHSFGGSNISNQVTVASGGSGTGLKWSDPLGASTNDYDLFVLDSGLTTVVDASDNVQNGSQDPFEFVAAPAAGRRFVIVLFSGSARALHLSTNRGRLAVSTSGAIYGHNAAGSAYTVAAVDSRTVGAGVFTTGNVVETYSSDGPRRIFYNPNGTAITPGNVLIGTNGGTVLAKVDVTAADCGVTTTPGFIPFCGTSAAAPTAAAIAALVKSRKPTALPAEIRTALTSTTLDIETAGFDRDAGFGIINAFAAVNAIGASSAGGIDTIGLYDPAHAAFFLRNTNSGGVADISLTFGPAGLGWLPIVGDWNGDGIDTIGLYDPAHAAFFLRNSNTGGIADVTFTFGPAGLGWIPLVGDWNGDGTDTIGLYDPAHAAFFLRNSNTGGVADISFTFGPAGLGFKPIVGDWNGDGTDTVGLYGPSTAAFFLKNTNSGGIADISFTFGPAGLGWIALVRDWNGDGTDTIGLYDPAHAAFFLRNTNSGGVADISFSFGPAGLGWAPLTGDWNGL